MHIHIHRNYIHKKSMSIAHHFVRRDCPKRIHGLTGTAYTSGVCAPFTVYQPLQATAWSAKRRTSIVLEKHMS